MSPLEHLRRAEELVMEVEEIEGDQEGDLDQFAQRHCDRALRKAAIHAQLAAIPMVQQSPQVYVSAAEQERIDNQRIAAAVRRNNPGVAL